MAGEAELLIGAHAGGRFARQAGIRARRRGPAGFTLVEMLVVLAIIGLIVGLVGPRVLTYLSQSKVKASQIQMENISTGLELFYLDTGRYPTTAEGLTALYQKPADAAVWSGPYLKSAVAPRDPWGHAYVYRSPGASLPFDLGSLGPDGREGAQVAVRRLQDGAR